MGPYTPADSSTGVQPDWYIGFIIGALRLFPRWDIHLGEYTVLAPFWPGIVLPLLVFLLLACYPLLERLLVGDYRQHHLLQRPRDNAVRTGLGAMALTFYLVLFVAGGDDLHSITLDISVEWFVWGGRVGLFVLPPLAYVVTQRVCRGLQREDRQVLERGIRTGLLRETSEGVFAEVRQPRGGVDHEGRPVPMRYGGARVGRHVMAAERERETERSGRHGSSGSFPPCAVPVRAVHIPMCRNCPGGRNAVRERAAVPAVLTLLVAGCSAGPAQSYAEYLRISGNGSEERVGDLLVRNAAFDHGSPSVGGVAYRKGASVSLRATVVNEGSTADRLVAVRSPVAGSSTVAGERVIPAGQSLTAGYGESEAAVAATGARRVRLRLSDLTVPGGGAGRSGLAVRAVRGPLDGDRDRSRRRAAAVPQTRGRGG